jgi:Icc-related predicted phosphoesterase
VVHNIFYFGCFFLILNSAVQAGDTVPPAAVSDLRAERGRTGGEIILNFTAPGNDGNSAERVLNGTYYVQYAQHRDDICWSKDKAQVIRPISNVNYGLEDRLIVALIGDPQYGFPTGTDPQPAVGNAILTFDDLKDVRHDFLVVLGDLVQPYNIFWRYHHKYTMGMATRPVYLISGNADFYLTPKIFTEETGLSLDPYKVVKRGVRFIFLHTTGVKTGIGSPENDNHQCEVGKRAMDWLKKELASDTTSTTIVFFHAPVGNTTYDSTERMRMVESEEVRALFNEYTNVKIFANGHVHYPYGATDSEGRGQYKREKHVLHISVGRPPDTLFLNIEKDRIYIRVRNNKERKWHTKYSYIYDTETTLQPKELDLQSVVIGNLEPGSKYYFRIWVEDKAGNCSEASVLASSP